MRGGLRPFRPLSRNSNLVVGGIALRELPSAVRSKLNLIMERNARGAFKNFSKKRKARRENTRQTFEVSSKNPSRALSSKTLSTLNFEFRTQKSTEKGGLVFFSFWALLVFCYCYPTRLRARALSLTAAPSRVACRTQYPVGASKEYGKLRYCRYRTMARAAY